MEYDENNEKLQAEIAQLQALNGQYKMSNEGLRAELSQLSRIPGTEAIEGQHRNQDWTPVRDKEFKTKWQPKVKDEELTGLDRQESRAEKFRQRRRSWQAWRQASEQRYTDYVAKQAGRAHKEPD